MKKTMLFCFLLSAMLVFSQNNLVPNPSFEELNPLPNLVRVSSIKDWCGATGSPGDYFYPNNPDEIEGVPKNIFGSQEPHTGNAYTGICIDYSEYIEAELLKPLIKGQEYKISFFISKSDKTHHYVKEMGILFLPKKKTWFLASGIKSKPDVDFVNEGGFKNEDDWVELSENYVARGDEAVLVLGHFLYDEPDGFKGKAHYYIDDVSITPIINETVGSIETIISTPQAPVIDTLRLEDLNFKFGTAELIGDYNTKLKDAVNYILAHPEKTVIAEGHTDNIGTEPANKKLSEARAKAVADYLIFKGIDANRVSFKGFGSLSPIDNNNTETSRKRNRRVDLIIMSK